MTKFKVGDRVRITTDREGSYGVRKGDLGTIDENDSRRPWVIWDAKRYADGRWCADIGDLQLITDGGEMNKPYERKTYRLLKGTAELSKGAVVQEMCDGGDQDFIVLDEAFVKYPNDHGNKRYTAPRPAVVEEPTWFVEVFKVIPEYMTRAELDEWQAFKSSKKPAARRRAPAKKTAS